MWPHWKWGLLAFKNGTDANCVDQRRNTVGLAGLRKPSSQSKRRRANFSRDLREEMSLETNFRVPFTTNKAVSHFRPMLPFAQGLKARGHDVRIAVLYDLAEEIDKHGFGHLELTGPSEAERADVNERASQVPKEEAGKSGPVPV